MRYRTTVVIGLAICALGFLFHHEMSFVAEDAVQEGLGLSSLQRFAIAASDFIGTFWWLLVPMLVVVLFGIAAASNRAREARPSV